MKKLLIGLLAVTSLSGFASTLTQALVDNSEKITQLKKICGSQISGNVIASAKEQNVLVHRITLQESNLGFVEKECEISIEVDSSKLEVDGPVTYTVTHRKL